MSSRSLHQRSARVGKLCCALVLTLALFLCLGEGAFRLGYPHGATYYTGRQVCPDTREFAFGTISTNREGYPDQEWGPAALPRVGWLGDSVVYGIGVGASHRLTEHLRVLAPHREHLNLGQLGYPGPRVDTGREVVALAGRLSLAQVVYVLNLNDIEPRRPPPELATTSPPSQLSRALRCHSALFEVLGDYRRLLATHSTEPTVFGLFPRENTRMIEALALEVARLSEGLERSGVRLSVALLPGEMQVSAPAADWYREQGLTWEEGLEEGSAQEQLRAALPPDLEVVDLRWAFLDPADPEGSRADAPMCEWYVCTDGGTLDWNHLNRAGHHAVAHALARSAILAPPSQRIARESHHEDQ